MEKGWGTFKIFKAFVYPLFWWDQFWGKYIRKPKPSDSGAIITKFLASGWFFSHSKMSLRILYTKRMSKVYSIVTTCNSYFTWTIPLKWLRFISGFKSATFNDSDLSKIDVTKEIFSLLELTPLFFFIFHWIQSFRWFIRILFSITSNLKIFEIQIFAYYHIFFVIIFSIM